MSVVVFDKTGTLTEGKPAVVAVAGATAPQQQVLELASAVQQYSDHPLAKAVQAEASRIGIAPRPASNAKALPGRGVQADVDGVTVYLGNKRLMQELAVSTQALDEPAAKHESAGRTVSWA